MSRHEERAVQKQRVNVGGYTRQDGTSVRGYSQSREAWQQVRVTGSLAAASAVTAALQIIIFGFTVVSTVLIVATSILTALAGLRAHRILRPTRTRRPKRRKAPRTAPRRGSTGRPTATHQRATSNTQARPTGHYSSFAEFLADKERSRQARRARWRARGGAVRRGTRRAAFAAGRGARTGARWAMAKVQRWRESRRAA